MSIRGLIFVGMAFVCATHMFAQNWCVNVTTTSMHLAATLPNYFTAPPVQPAVPSTYYVRFIKKPGAAVWTHDVLPKKSLEEWLATNTIFNAPPTSDSLNVTCTYHISKPSGSEQIDGLRRGSCFATPLTIDTNVVATKEVDEWVPVEREPSFDNNELQRAVKYPELARLSSIQGRVWIAVLLSKTGAVRKVQVIESDSPYLNDAAVNAVLSTTFQPAYQNSKPVTCWIRIPLLFQLK